LEKKADIYEVALNVECFIHGIDNPLSITVEEMIALLARPDEPLGLPIPAGWDNFHYGRAAR